MHKNDEGIVPQVFLALTLAIAVGTRRPTETFAAGKCWPEICMFLLFAAEKHFKTRGSRLMSPECSEYDTIPTLDNLMHHAACILILRGRRSIMFGGGPNGQGAMGNLHAGDFAMGEADLDHFLVRLFL